MLNSFYNMINCFTLYLIVYEIVKMSSVLTLKLSFQVNAKEIFNNVVIMQYMHSYNI